MSVPLKLFPLSFSKKVKIKCILFQYIPPPIVVQLFPETSKIRLICKDVLLNRYVRFCSSLILITTNIVQSLQECLYDNNQHAGCQVTQQHFNNCLHFNWLVWISVSCELNYDFNLTMCWQMPGKLLSGFCYYIHALKSAFFSKRNLLFAWWACVSQIRSPAWDQVFWGGYGS